MELSEEGLKVAAVTRETVKRKAAEVADKTTGDNAPAQPAKKQAAPGPRPRPPCTHEVAMPQGFDKASITLDPALHGGCQHGGTLFTAVKLALPFM